MWWRGEAYTGFWWGKLRERDNLGNPGVDGRIILRWTLRKWDFGVWTGSSWLRIETEADTFIAVMNLLVLNMRGLSSLAEFLLESQERLCCME